MRTLLDTVRSIWVYSNLFVVTITLSSIVVVCALLRARGRVYDWAGRAWAHWMLFVSGVRVRVTGLEHATADRPRIFASNHQSWFDVFALAACLPGPYRFVAKKELGRIPIFGHAWRAAGHISVDRGDRQSAIQSLNEAGARLRRDNGAVIIFPEGTRSPTGDLLPFRKGAFMLALHTGVDIIPVGVSGSREILGKTDWRVRNGEIRVRIGVPIPTAEYSTERRDLLIARVRSDIEQLMRTPAEATATGA
ncbi:MAG: 1-acyl-sn-glycerol-3-phosphate acyltransferase [Gemmatimonadetes bacterium]|nr:1-acyl-sn-glycerol-3-phosphate acyltransferase [Gemmatimonadota bacterium]